MTNAGSYTAEEACRRLGVHSQTLYAYVSRGLIRSEPGPHPRRRLYSREDIELLIQRRDLRKHPRHVLARALEWGAPILDSSLTTITNGRCYYRGKPADALAEQWEFGSVVRWFWTGNPDSELPTQEQSPIPGEASPLERFQSRLPGWTHHSDPTNEATALVTGLCATITGKIVHSVDPIPNLIGRRWRKQRPSDIRLIEQALILCVDHELNISSFTARCVASAGSSLADAVNAAFSAFRGFRHGGNTELVEDLFDQFADLRRPGKKLEALKRATGMLPGFGHPMYPAGDPRAARLLRGLNERRPASRTQEMIRRLAAIGEGIAEAGPNIDFALVALRRAMGAPRGCGLELFAQGRIVGWIGHALEQTTARQLIRPRSRYTGPVLEEGH